jgi:SPP1 family predicted phage head-tail adaptor
MHAGRLDRKITIQRKSTTPSDSGEPVETWSTLGVARRSASYKPVRGDERYSGEQIVGEEQVEFRIRYSSEMNGLSSLDRVIYPALEGGESEGDLVRFIYDILAVHKLGRREGLQIIANRRPDLIYVEEDDVSGDGWQLDFSSPDYSGLLAALEDI